MSEFSSLHLLHHQGKNFWELRDSQTQVSSFSVTWNCRKWEFISQLAVLPHTSLLIHAQEFQLCSVLKKKMACKYDSWLDKLWLVGRSLAWMMNVSGLGIAFSVPITHPLIKTLRFSCEMGIYMNQSNNYSYSHFIIKQAELSKVQSQT